jgi:hypothetical protein
MPAVNRAYFAGKVREIAFFTAQWTRSGKFELDIRSLGKIFRRSARFGA